MVFFFFLFFLVWLFSFFLSQPREIFWEDSGFFQVDQFLDLLVSEGQGRFSGFDDFLESWLTGILLE